jgi:hypothetical protein
MKEEDLVWEQMQVLLQKALKKQREGRWEREGRMAPKIQCS